MTSGWRAAGRRLEGRAPTLLVVALLALTSGAFVHTEQQKLSGSPLRVVDVDELFSPVCRCATARATIALTLRTRSRITLAVVNEQGDAVRTLIDDRPLEGKRAQAAWDGRDDAGRLVPDGIYRPRLHVASERRTFLLVNRIRVDTTPPAAAILRVDPVVLTPDGDGRGDRLTLRYRLSERAQPLLYVDDRLAVRGYSRRREGKFNWYGKIRGRPLRAGVHRLRLAARDDAGNLGARGRAVVVHILIAVR